MIITIVVTDVFLRYTTQYYTIERLKRFLYCKADDNMVLELYLFDKNTKDIISSEIENNVNEHQKYL